MGFTILKILQHLTQLLTPEPIVIFQKLIGGLLQNNKVDAADQNVYIGIGEGFATNVGNGHVMQVNKTKQTFFNLGDQILRRRSG
nr:hypothetical protein [Bacteroidota bacterium]